MRIFFVSLFGVLIVVYSSPLKALDLSIEAGERDLDNDLRFGNDIESIAPTLDQTFGYRTFDLNQDFKLADNFSIRLRTGLSTINSGSWSFNSGNIKIDGDGGAGLAWGTGFNWMIVKDSWGLKWYTDWDFSHLESDLDEVDQEVDQWNTTFGIKRDVYATTFGAGLRYSDASLRLEGSKSGNNISVDGDAAKNVGLIFTGRWRVNKWFSINGNLRTMDELAAKLQFSFDLLYDRR